MAAGTRVRVVNEVPATLYRDWYQWRRYEAAVNVAHAQLDAWGLCVYDERRLSPDRVQDLLGTHPFIGRGLDRRTNPDYQEPRAFCAANFDAPPDTVERVEPDLDLLDPSLVTARAAVRDLVGNRTVPTIRDVEALVLATNEAVANATVHGRPPVGLRGWALPGRVVVTVTDTGRGPRDCFLGLLRSPEEQGMWLSHQLVDVAHRRHSAGYTVRLTATAESPHP
jgi:anti-sigma regulatory factor (Ser/Thr protein kinase)